jgi:hypothetical protein
MLKENTRRFPQILSENLGNGADSGSGKNLDESACGALSGIFPAIGMCIR